MEAFTIEQSLQEGEKEIKELFDFIREQGKELEAYEVEWEHSPILDKNKNLV